MVRKLKERVNDKNDQNQSFEVKSRNSCDVAGEGVPPKRSRARGWCHTRREGETEPATTDVAGGINLYFFKSQEKGEDPGCNQTGDEWFGEI